MFSCTKNKSPLNDTGMRVYLALIAFGLFAAGGARAAEITADEVAAQNAQTDQVAAWTAAVEIVDSRNGEVERQRAGDVKSRLAENGKDAERFYRFSNPQDIKGTVLLIHEHGSADDDIWLYLPSLGKSRRIAVGGKKNSFVGTQYVFADLMSFAYEKFKHTLVGSDKCQEEACWLLESVPKQAGYAQDIGYSKLRSWITKAGYRTARIDYFDLTGQRYKTQTFEAYANADASARKALATKRVMTNLRTGQATLIHLRQLEFPPAIKASEFSPRLLTNR